MVGRPPTEKPQSLCSQGCQVGLYEANLDKFGPFLKHLASELLRIYLVVGLFFQVQACLELGLFPKVYLVKSKIWPFLKQSLAFFSHNLLATLPVVHDGHAVVPGGGEKEEDGG